MREHPLAWLHGQQQPGEEQAEEVTLQDSPFAMTIRYHIRGTTLAFTDHRTDISKTHDFAGCICPCAQDSRGDVLLLQQLPHAAWVRLLCWTPPTDQLREEVAIQAGSGVLKDEYQLFNCSSLSPDNRYLLLSLKSCLGPYRDLWLVDREQGKARLLRPNFLDGVFEDGQVIWYKQQAFCGGHSPRFTTLRIDLDALCAEAMALPVPRKVR